MTHANLSVRVGGTWLAAASLLMIAALASHGRIDPDLGVQMTKIADHAVRWVVVHWLAAAALSLYAVAGLVVLTSRTRLTDGPWTLTAWAVITVGALWTVTTAVAETTAMTTAAVAGSREMFEVWWAFAEGKATGFAFVALAVAVVAGHEARATAAATPAWAAWTAAGAGVGAFTGWVLGMWLGLGFGSLLWLASSLVMSAWTLWFGVVLARVPSTRAEVRASLVAG